jgi:F-type H+-transporting ATPase subunit alpha
MKDAVGAVLLIGGDQLSVGDECVGTGRVVEIPVGEQLLGRVVDPIGRPLDGKGPLNASKTRPVESPSAAIIERSAVKRPLQTGLMSIDSMVPIGKGQRELIIGDRQTGKTAIAIDTIINQRGTGTLCVYVAIGQKASTIAGVIGTLQKYGALEYTTVVSSTASDSAPMQYLAPYAGCAVAEAFMYEGRDVLVVYDDLTKHAVAYRAMSLLLRRPPGREAYPGDVFYLHSRLLERAAQLAPEKGGGSMTALPIIETAAGDISAYIPTNVISITDGQIFLSTELFNAGTRPAVNVGLSVSRVGGSAQTKAMRTVSGQLRLDLAQYRELAVFSQFGSDLDHATRERLEQGGRLTRMLVQSQYAPYTMAQQVVLLYAVTRGLLNDVDEGKRDAFKTEFPAYVAKNYPHVLNIIAHDAEVSEQTESGIREAVERYLKG